MLCNKSSGKIIERRKSVGVLKSILIPKDLPFALCGRRRKSVSFAIPANAEIPADIDEPTEMNMSIQERHGPPRNVYVGPRKPILRNRKPVPGLIPLRHHSTLTSQMILGVITNYENRTKNDGAAGSSTNTE